MAGAAAVPSTHRRWIDRAVFWYFLMLVALVLLLLSFWLWNSPTATQSGLPTTAVAAQATS